MLPRTHRLTDPAEFREVTRRGRRLVGGSVVLHVLADGSQAPTTVGFVVGKRVGGSVVRHRVQRQLRHAALAWVAARPTGVRIVVRALPGADQRGAADATSAWQRFAPVTVGLP